MFKTIKITAKIENFSRYEFLENGKIISFRSKEPKEIKQSKTYNGYCIVTLFNDQKERIRKSAHRWIWEAFNGKIPEGKHLHHKNYNGLDNSISNLELIDASEHLKIHKTGYKWKEESKIKLSNRMKGESNPFYGKHHSEETRRKLSEMKKRMAS